MALASGTGLISGLPVNDIITRLLALRQQPITLLQGRVQTFTNQQQAYVAINNALLNLRTAATNVSEADSFGARTAFSSDESAFTVTAADGADAGSHTVEVLQLATAHRLGSQGIADSDATAVAAASGLFAFKVGSSGTVKSVSVGPTTTLEDLRNAINALDAGVTASIINDGSATNPYRLVLTSDNAGSANSIIITQNDTTLDFANPIIEEAAAATGNTYAGTATSSGTYTGAASKRYVVEVTTGGDLGTAKFRVSEDGGVTWSASDAFTTSATATEIFSGASGDGVDIAFSAGTFAVGDRFTIDAFAPEIQRPQDAVVRVDGITVTRDSNTVADVISGVTLNLSQTTSTPATISVSQDTQTIRGRIVTFVQQYNEVRNQIARYTAFDPETQVRGPLLGDLTVRTLQNTLANTVTSQVPGLSQSGINSLAGIGITVNSDGQLVVDDAKLDDALETNFATVKKLFALVGATTSSKLSYVDSTTATQPGTYAVNITAAAEQAAILSSQDITGPLGNAEVLTFTVGSDTHTVTVAAGSTLDQAVTSINSQLSDQGVAIEASRVGDKLRLATTDYGSAATITVKSDQSGASSTQLGIGTTDRTDSGVDVAGTIGGQSAKGVGQTLTANTGTKAEGLSVLVTATIPGLVGDITVSSGVAQQLAMTLESLTDAEDGSIAVRQKGLSDSIDQINDQIEKMQESISTEETRLRAQFASLETLLAQYNSTSSFLTNQLAQLAQLTTSR